MKTEMKKELKKEMKNAKSKMNMTVLALTAVTLTMMVPTAQAIQKTQEKAVNNGISKKAAVTPATEQQIFGDHHQTRALKASERRPAVPMQMNAKTKYGTPDANTMKTLNRPSQFKLNSSSANSLMKAAPAVAASCNVQLFASSSGTALVNAVKSSTTDCVNELFSVTGATAGQVFSEAKMVTISDAFRTAATSYNGTNAGSALQMVMFLRAGYYVNYYDSASTGTYGNALKTSIRASMDAFVNNGNFGLVNDAHGETLSEFVTLIDSSTENARYLTTVVKRLLNNYNSSYSNSWWMKSATNNVFTVLFRGHQNADFKTLVQSDPSVVDALYNFVNNNFNMLGTDTEYLIANAGREMGRFLQYPENSNLKSIAKSRVKLMIDRSNVTGVTAPLWVGLGEMVDYFDKANCSYYGICDFVQRLETNVLPISYSCSPTLRLKAQALTNAQLVEACSIVGGEETYFHTQAATGKIPVGNDNNTQLEMVVFKSSQDYGTYAGAIYGIDTNNGGMYLEGSPEVVGNQARFIAYQAEWMLPKFEIWNLTHEYIHYLDGRFNIYGDFNAALGVNSIWWIEGFAEYMSYSYRNLAYDGAKTAAAAGTYNLSTIFQNDYNSGQTRVYNWGYLAVRYLFEKQRNKVSNILGYLRPGNWTGYASYLSGSNMGTSMDADFKNWLPCVNTPTLPQCSGTTPTNNPPVANFSSAVSGLNVSFTNSSTDSDGTVASYAWNFGDGTSSTLKNPSKAYSAGGTYTVSLVVTDNKGAQSAAKSASVTVQGTATNVAPVANFTSSVSGLNVNFTSTSTDSDGTVASYAWTFGDNTTSTLANPTKAYANAGTYNVSLVVTDNKGAKSAAKTASVTVTSGGTSLPECPGAANALGKNCTRSNVSAPAGDYSYMYIYVPAGTKQLRITTSGGTGNADLYVSTLGQWATRNYYNYGSYNAGNTESVTVNNPPAGYVYISLYGQSAFSGVKVTTQY